MVYMVMMSLINTKKNYYNPVTYSEQIKIFGLLIN